jgi:hypothetical protein
MDRTEAIIFIAVVAVCVALVLVAQIQSRTCPKCGDWRKTKRKCSSAAEILMTHIIKSTALLFWANKICHFSKFH